MSDPDSSLERILAAALRLAALVPLLLLAALLYGYALAPAGAAEPSSETCGGTNLLDEMRRSDPQKLAGIEAEAAKTPNGDGRLYRIEKGNLAPSYLFGTMHLSDPRVLALPAAAGTAFAASTRLVIETTDILDQKSATGALLARPDLTMLPAGKTLGDFLKPDEKRRVEAGLAAHGIPFDAVKTLQPWFSGMSLVIPACEAARKAGGRSVLDIDLASRAKAAGKDVLGLESAVEQLQAMASLPMRLQIENLLATLDLESRMPDVMETMVDLYTAGRIAMITPMIAAMDGPEAGGAADYAEFEKRIVTDRNETMAERLEPILARGGDFVAVGALHLPGKDGLVERLRAKGYAVSRLD